MNSGQQAVYGQQPSGATAGVNVPVVPPTVSYTAFVDESSVEGVRTAMGKLYGYAAVVVPTAWMPTLASWMDWARAQHGIDPGEELKWSPKKARQPSQHALGTLGREPLQRDLLAAARAAGAFSVAVICDTGRDGLGERDREEVVLTFLYERISMGVRDRGGIATVIFDSLFDTIADEARRLAKQWSAAAQGTAYVSPGAIPVPYLSASSEHMPGLQLADLVTAGTVSLVAGRKPGLALREPLLTLAQRRADGRIDGAGLKLWPTELSNLYHWLDRPAETAARGGLAAHWLPYAHDDGLPAPTTAP